MLFENESFDVVVGNPPFLENITQIVDCGKVWQEVKLEQIENAIIEKDFKISKNAFIRNNSVLLQRFIAHIQNPNDHIKITGAILENIKEFSNKYILALLNSKNILKS